MTRDTWSRCACAVSSTHSLTRHTHPCCREARAHDRRRHQWVSCVQHRIAPPYHAINSRQHACGCRAHFGGPGGARRSDDASKSSGRPRVSAALHSAVTHARAARATTSATDIARNDGSADQHKHDEDNKSLCPADVCAARGAQRAQLGGRGTGKACVEDGCLLESGHLARRAHARLVMADKESEEAGGEGGSAAGLRLCRGYMRTGEYVNAPPSR